MVGQDPFVVVLPIMLVVFVWRMHRDMQELLRSIDERLDLLVATLQRAVERKGKDGWVGFRL